jgi:hypothetical protein
LAIKATNSTRRHPYRATIYVVHGLRIHTLHQFWREIGEA